ncbi:hypothetical protein [Salinisphaera sp. G21_0]|uniref:hypothetical protein n=1 Tax=Salinisphaera sp. G21_0 TaxID=2821094 RepID=UPI001ADC10FA|nr:hypothetical protein [Salinisphaera sp. G21_0]MBO9480948.1 hypothetical protein [Salinisphaera sp. G21_0]
MDRLYFTAQVNAAPDHLSYVQDTASSEPGTSGRAFSRDVGETATSLYIVSRDETTENHLQQPAVPFHNPFDDPRFEKRSIVIIDGLTRQDQVLDITVRRKLQRSEPTYIYNVGLPQRASQCLLCVDNNLHQPAYTTDWAFVNHHVKPATPVTMITDSVPFQSGTVYAESKKALKNAREKARYQNDPAYAKRKKEYNRVFRRNRLQNDPAYAESTRVRNNARERARYKNDPVFAKRKNEGNKVRRRTRLQNDPAYAERLRERDRDRKRTRYQNDPAYAQRERERKRMLQRKSRLRKSLRESTKRSAVTMSSISQSARERAKENAIGILPLNPGTIYPGQSKLPFSNLNFYEKEWSQGGVQ